MTMSLPVVDLTGKKSLKIQKGQSETVSVSMSLPVGVSRCDHESTCRCFIGKCDHESPCRSLAGKCDYESTCRSLTGKCDYETPCRSFTGKCDH